jgi:DNA-binding CsgD family transcriptional regulator
MNILSFLSAIIMTVILIQGFFVLINDIKSEANRLFFILCLFVSVWLMGGSFGFSSSTKEEASFWVRFASIGYISFQPVGVHFVSSYTKTVKSWLIYLIYIPAIIFLYLSFSGNFVFRDIYRYGNNWVLVPDFDTVSIRFFAAHCIICYIVSLTMLYFYMRRSKSFRIKKQSRMIFVALSITIVVFNIETFFASIFFDYRTYGQAPIYSVIWISIIWYAMKKYRLLQLKTDFIPGDVMDSIKDMVIITDTKKNVIMVNRSSLHLGLEKNIVSLEEIFAEHEMVDRLMEQAREKPVTGIMLNLVLPGREMVLVKGAISLIKDGFADAAGFVIIASTIEDLYTVLSRWGITKREYELIKLVITGNSNRIISEQLDISRRTVETHIANIFNKLGLNKRSELISYSINILLSSGK